jgi:hypothetical protein
MADESKQRTVRVISAFQQSESDKRTVFILPKTLVFDEEGKLIDVKPCAQETFQIIGGM